MAADSAPAAEGAAGLLVNLALAFGVSAGAAAGLRGPCAVLFERPEGQPRTADEWVPGANDDHFYTLKRRGRSAGRPQRSMPTGCATGTHPGEERPEDVWRVAVLGDSVTRGVRAHRRSRPFRRGSSVRLEADGERVQGES